MTAFDTLPPKHRTVIRNALTDRQHQVFELLATGQSTRGVAIRLGLQRTTVREHIDAGIRRLERCPPDTRAALRAAGIDVREPLLTSNPRDTEANPQNPHAPTKKQGA